MASENLPISLSLTFGHEGGLSVDPSDPGNWSTGKVRQGALVGTKYGVTGRVLGAHRKLGRSATLDEVKALTLDEASDVYRTGYWGPARCDDLPPGLDYAVFDFSINSGVSRAIKSLQRVLGVSQDGVVGPVTLQAISKRKTTELIQAYINERMRFFKVLKNWPQHGRGWTIRVTGKDPKGQWASKPGVIGEALALANGKKPAAIEAPADQSAKSDTSEVKTTSTPEGQSAAVVIVGAIGAGVATMTEQLADFSHMEAVQGVFVVLLIVGAAANAFLSIKRAAKS